MRPIDPRLLRYARSTRGFLAAATALGVVTCLVVIAQARVLSGVVVDVSQGASAHAVLGAIAAVVALFVARGLLAWLIDISAVRASARAKEDLRAAALESALATAPDARAQAASIAALVTRGIDALDAYYARYLPQLVLAILVPVAVLVAIVVQDLLSAIIIAVTLPLIPVFMILIGMYTRTRVDRQWRTLALLSGHFLDLVSGLPTLKAFGRARAQETLVAEVGDRYRRSTMGVLRVSFLSSLALELLATLSVALVAVTMGLRLDSGRVTYAVALFVLVLAPEAYLPLRLVGQHFHAAAEGVGAADRVLAIIKAAPVTGTGLVVAPGPVSIEFVAPGVQREGRPVLEGPVARALPGSVTAVVGASGAGKSTLLALLLGFVRASSGDVRVQAKDEDVSLGDLDLALWRQRLAWLDQSASVVDSGLSARPRVCDVVRLGRPNASDAEVMTALANAGLAIDLHDRIAADGTRLSAGQQQRLLLARVLVAQADVVLLDEPTAALDPQTEEVVTRAIRSEADRGATVIVVAHRPALVASADQVVRLEAPRESDDAVMTEPMVPALPGAGW